MPNIPPTDQPNQSPEKDAAQVQLGADLWIDLDAGMVIRGQNQILLTAREVRVLQLLVQSLRNGRGYLSAQAIADRIHLSVGDPEHAIEQNIRTIRQKLGETVYLSRILRGRRGFGYRLFPEVEPKHQAQPERDT